MASKIGNGITGTEVVKSQIKGTSQDAAHNRLGGRVWRVQIEPPRDTEAPARLDLTPPVECLFLRKPEASRHGMAMTFLCDREWRAL
jgi:hypothetical protein